MVSSLLYAKQSRSSSLAHSDWDVAKEVSYEHFRMDIIRLVVGVVGKFLMPGRDPGGFVLTILLGIAGALIGGFVGQSLGFYQPGEPAGFVMAVIGSIILLLLYRMFVGRRV